MAGTLDEQRRLTMMAYRPIVKRRLSCPESFRGGCVSRPGGR